jgi:hypothetical protein
MTADRLSERLRELPTPHSTEARERTVARARAEVGGRDRGAGAPRPDRRWLLGLAAAALLVAVLLLTPPGKAASAWVGELVGIGDVGGKPTLERHPGGERGSAVVIDNGRAPDGSSYEWVAYACEVDLRDEGQPTHFRGIGLALEWPGVKSEHSSSAACEQAAGGPEPKTAFRSHGVHILPSQFKGVAEPDLVISGSVGPSVHRVEIVYTDGRRRRQDLPVDFARVTGKLRKLTGRREALGTFTAFMPGARAARDELVSRLDLRALADTGKLRLGPIGRRERRQARRAFRTCAPKKPDFSALPAPPGDKALERAFRPYERCMNGHLPRGPIEYVAYDERGKVLERRREPLVAATLHPPRTERLAGREQPGDARWRRPLDPQGGKPVVIASGRAPEGALYEFYVQRFKRRSGVRGGCVQQWWPYVHALELGARGYCGPGGLPPSTAFGRRHPERVAARPYGFLEEAFPATRHWITSGYTRPNVSRVRIVYRNRAGRWRHAPVQLTHIDGPLLRRIGETRPFGFFVAFVPRSVDRCTDGKPFRCMALRVFAYGEDGSELGRVKHRSD